MFAALWAGTAAVISPIGEIKHNDALITINGGKSAHSLAEVIR